MLLMLSEMVLASSDHHSADCATRYAGAEAPLPERKNAPPHVTSRGTSGTSNSAVEKRLQRAMYDSWPSGLSAMGFREASRGAEEPVLAHVCGGETRGGRVGTSGRRPG